jgi:hypothetical protein
MRRTLCLGAVVCLAGVAQASAAGVLYGLNSVANDPSTLYTLDPSTGSVTSSVPLTGSAVFASYTDLAYLDGTLYASDVFGNSGFGVVSINTTTGATNLIYNQGRDTNWHAMAADTNAGVLYAQSFGELVSYNPATNVASSVGPMTLPDDSFEGMAFDPVANQLYGVSFRGDFYQINTTTAVATFLGSTGVTGPQSGLGLTYDPTSASFYLSAAGDMAQPNVEGRSPIYRFTLASIASPQLLGIPVVDGFGIDGVEFVVPEPSSVALLAAGALTLLRRRRRS